MNNEEIAVALESFKHEIGSLKHRMDAAEKSGEALSELTTSMRVMTLELKNQGETMQDIKKDVTALGGKVDVIEGKPGKRWDAMAEKVFGAVLLAVIAFLLGRIGL